MKAKINKLKKKSSRFSKFINYKILKNLSFKKITVERRRNRLRKNN